MNNEIENTKNFYPICIDQSKFKEKNRYSKQFYKYVMDISSKKQIHRYISKKF